MLRPVATMKADGSPLYPCGGCGDGRDCFYREKLVKARKKEQLKGLKWRKRREMELVCACGRVLDVKSIMPS